MGALEIGARAEPGLRGAGRAARDRFAGAQVSAAPVVHLERAETGSVWCGVSMEEVRGMTNVYGFARCVICRRLALADAHASVQQYRRQRSLRRNAR